MSEHEEIENAIAAWVLGATDPDEAETISRHLEGCATCRAMVARFRSITDAVPLAVEEAEPDPRLRQRILAAAAYGQTGATAARSEIRAMSAPRQRRRVSSVAADPYPPLRHPDTSTDTKWRRTGCYRAIDAPVHRAELMAGGPDLAHQQIRAHGWLP